VAHSCTIGNKVALKKKTLKSFKTNVKRTTIFGLLQKIFHFTHIWGHVLTTKKKREPIGGQKKFLI
jgi:acyl-[acyl carrier protein]--UDP-N-acetylglucosamine O-acyltransferase